MKLYLGFLLLGVLTALSVESAGEEPLYRGLGPCISEFEPERVGAFEIDSNDFLAPPVTDDVERTITAGGTDIYSGHFSYENRVKLLQTIFPNREFIYWPAGAFILRNNPTESSLNWVIPENVTFFHRFYLKRRPDANLELFELRVLKRVKYHWAFGIYERSPKNFCGGNLSLRKNPVDRPQEFDAVDSEFGLIRYRARPLSPRSCIECHGMSLSKIASLKKRVGPCSYKWVRELSEHLGRPLFTDGSLSGR